MRNQFLQKTPENPPHCHVPLKGYKYGLWRAVTSNKVVIPTRQVGNRFLGSVKGFKYELRFRRNQLIKNRLHGVLQGTHQRRQCILFSVVFTHSPPSHLGSVWVLPVISLLLMGGVSWDPKRRRSWFSKYSILSGSHHTS